MEPVVIAALISAGSQLLGGLTGDKGGGAGGATSASVQPGQTGLQYQDVVGTDVPDFIWQEYQEQLAEEDEQRKIAEAMALAQEQGLWSGGLISLMQGGPLYANEGMEIYVPPPPPIDTEIDLDLEIPEPDIDFDLEPIGEPGDDLEEILRKQEIRDAIAQEGIGLLTQLLTSKLKEGNTSSTVSARRSVTPLPGGGLGKRQAPYPQPKGSGITPFMYRGVADGGVLGRSMFAQNYMPHGGAMQGPGGPKDDLIPVMASDGEYMLSKAAVDQAGGGNHARGIANLEQFNNMGNRRYGW